MTDVAKIAGVSQSTVSMVLNNVTSARLSADTRSKVLYAVSFIASIGVIHFYGTQTSPPTLRSTNHLFNPILPSF